MRKRGFILVLLVHCSLFAIPQSFNFSQSTSGSKVFTANAFTNMHYASNLNSLPLNIPGNSSAPAVCKEIDWAVWDSFKGNSAIGTINNNGSNVSIILNANFGIQSTPQMERYDVFKRYKAPVLDTAVPRTSWSKETGGKITICFSQTVKEPVLLLASLGSYKDRIKTTVSFSEPYVMLYNGGGVVFDDNNTITGREGYAIIKFPGDIKCITINSSSYENFTDFTWGIPVCPDGTPKPASAIVPKEPKVIPPPIAAIVKPVQPEVAAVPVAVPAPKAAVLHKSEPVVLKVEQPKPVIAAAIPEVLPKPVPAKADQIPEPKPTAIPAELKPARVVAGVPVVIPKPVSVISPPVISIAQNPVVAVPVIEAKPNPIVAAVPVVLPEQVLVKPTQPIISAQIPTPKPIVAAPVAESKPSPPIAVASEIAPKPVPVKPVPPMVAAPPIAKRVPVVVAPPVVKPVLSPPAKPVNAVLIQNSASASQRRFLKIEVYDYDSKDYDSVSLKLNGKPIGPKAIPLPLYKRYGSQEFTYVLELQPGDNTLEVFCISEGIKPFATVGIFIIYDGGRKNYQIALKAKEITLIHL